MKEPKNAFPTTRYPSGEYCYGMSKRFYAACAAMQGLLANPSLHTLYTHNEIISFSFEIADELLKQE